MMMPERLYVPETDSPGAIKKALNDGGWVDGLVLAAGDLRQGKEPSLTSMLTGTALVEVLRPPCSKSLPRHFVLALTADRIVAFKALGSGNDEAGVYELWLRPDEFASWPREAVRLLDVKPHVDCRHPRARPSRTSARCGTEPRPFDRRAARAARRSRAGGAARRALYDSAAASSSSTPCG
jgi:hypothetical protein